MFPGLIFTFQMIYQIILLHKYKFHPKGILMYYDKYCDKFNKDIKNGPHQGGRFKREGTYMYP